MLRHGALAYEWNRYLGMASLASGWWRVALGCSAPASGARRGRLV